MNVNYKKLIIGLLLLAQFSTAIANSGSTIYTYNYVMQYERCSVKLLDDNSVEVSFNMSLAPTIYEWLHSRHMEELARFLKIPQSETKHIKFNPNRALLSLYFYHADGTRDLVTQLNNISDISLNGITPSGSKENIQEIQFNRKSLFPSDYYTASFNIAANTLANIRIAATVGAEFSYNGQAYSLLSAEGVSFSSDGKSCAAFDPQADIVPEALKIEPKFRMDSAVWQLKTLDLDELLDNTVNNSGLPTQIINAAKNRFCLNYRSIATRNNSYRISATNINGLAANNQHFQLKEQEGNNFINYKVELNSDENAGANFELPKDKKNIQLKSDNNQVRSKMCWEPNIILFGTDTTDKGSYSDILNFTITPLA
ncbi:hypothetical protein ACF3VQ_19845 [Yersinia sp. HM-2024]|uniref:hypothetical protein n=1 Tax=Yersinia sp. HM-2024 TaxID=3344550 RepID=UPI00370D6767